MNVVVEECRKLKQASARLQDVQTIYIKVPRHWPRAFKQEVITELSDRLTRKNQRDLNLLERHGKPQEKITIENRDALEAFVRQINAETFNAPLGKIRLGNSRHTQLAQVNLKTKTLTVSRYCLHNAPLDALRYLIIHELAHYFEGNHSKRFWALVAQYVPDYRLQSRIIKAFHQQAVLNEAVVESSVKQVPQQPVKVPVPTLSFFRQLSLWATGSPGLG